MTRVCHFSSAHEGLDVRIFHKECTSLAEEGYDTHLVITATNAEIRIAADHGVTIHAVPPETGRLNRMILKAWRCYKIARSISADIYQFHDPELIPYGILLALSGRKVVYDVHEDVPLDILTKEWIPIWFRTVASSVVRALEHVGASKFFYIASATPFIAQRFKKVAPYCVDINNFPILNELDTLPNWDEKHLVVCYVGSISKIRGIVDVTQAMSLVQSSARLHLAGQFDEVDLSQSIQALPGWEYVDALGFLDRNGVRDLLAYSMGGIVTLHPVLNYVDALPVKMFEYMSAGIPVIASDFPLWRDIITRHDCGILVDPLEPSQIAKAIDYIVTHPTEAQRMGRNGRKAIVNNYNWANETKKLLKFYSDVLA